MTDADEVFDRLREFCRLKQLERGLPEFFAKDDIVRFPKGVWYNRERDYKIEAVFSNGFVVSSNGFKYEYTDESAIRLGMVKKKEEES